MIHLLTLLIVLISSEDLHLNVQSQSSGGNAARAPTRALNTIDEVFAALRACWIPPPLDRARPGMEISVRLSFNRAGAILGEPRFTFLTRGVSPEVRATYQRAVVATLNRCTPLRLTPQLGGALAGRPFRMRFIDTRGFRQARSACSLFHLAESDLAPAAQGDWTANNAKSSGNAASSRSPDRLPQQQQHDGADRGSD
jgi:hypothetical protein